MGTGAGNKQSPSARNKRVWLLCLLLMLVLGQKQPVGAQTRWEIWPELDVWHRLDQHTRLLFAWSGTRSADSGDKTDGELALYLDARLGKRESIRIGYDYLTGTPSGPGGQKS